MPIAQLPDETVHLLRSTVVLNDACSVIKELLDNALDSQATTISIEVSANALDVIQVRDDGKGVGIEDRQLLCKRGCTSKIRTFDDLQNLGGQYLGFRGEALSSIADISEHVVITTRVEGEVVGTAMRFGPKGKLLSSASASHPIGTTVRVQSFLCQIPVRKQVAIKSSSKILAKVKKLLFNYAFARPSVRFSFKILKRENDKNNWSFAPEELSGQLMAAATQIVGKEMAIQCATHTTSITTADGACYTADALLIAPDADEAVKRSFDQYASIDGRPLATDRGTIKEISNLYKQTIKTISLAEKQNKVATKPFFVLKIDCPRGSYDVNVEPAKDVVLFHQVDTILELVRKLFAEVYGYTLQDDQCSIQLESEPVSSIAPSFDILLARKRPNAKHLTGDEEMLDSDNTISSKTTTKAENVRKLNISTETFSSVMGQEEPASKVHALTTMYDSDSEADMSIMQQKQASVLDICEAAEAKDSNTNNPWIRNPFTTAALHTRVRPKNITACTRSDDNPALAINATPTTLISSSSPMRAVLPAAADISYLPTPSRSPTRVEVYQNPGPPVPRYTRRDCIDTDDDEDVRDTTAIHPATKSQQRLLQNWIQSSRMSQQSAESLPPQLSPPNSNHNIQHSNISDGTQGSGVLTSYSGVTPQRPFKSPTKKPSRLPVNIATDRSSLSTDQQLEVQTELDQIMDFEYRKRAVNQRPKIPRAGPNPAELARLQQESLRHVPSESHLSSSRDNTGLEHDNPSEVTYATNRNQQAVKSSQQVSPHKNRYQAALRALESPDRLRLSLHHHTRNNTNEHDLTSEPSITQLEWPRPENLDMQAGHSSNTKSNLLKRPKKSQIALEFIPKNDIKHNISYTPSRLPSLRDLQIEITNLTKHDEYIKKGTVDNLKWSPFSPRLETWRSTLENMVAARYRRENKNTSADEIPQEWEFKVDLFADYQGAFTTT